MSDSSSDPDPLAALAEEFLARYRRGEFPALAEYTGRHPELAAQIRELFPALVMMEDVRPAPPAAPQPRPGVEGAHQRIGDFRIVREIGRGGMGVVYEAEQLSLNRQVALKVLPRSATADVKQVRRFDREAKAAGRLHHTNIVPVFGVGEADGTHFYVMQYIAGQPLDQVLAEVRRLRAEPTRLTAGAGVAHSLVSNSFPSPPKPEPQDDPALTQPSSPSPAAPITANPSATTSGLLSAPRSGYPYAIARLGAQAADALDYAARQGVLHRDIKPSNLLLDVWGTVWVTDFGLAKATGQEDLTRQGDILGTLRYMAPERFQGKADIRGDVYALGLTLYEMLALEPAFDATDRAGLMQQVMYGPPRRLDAIDPTLPADLVTVVHKATAPDPAYRYATAAEMANDLRRFLEDRPITARRTRVLERGWRWCRRNRGMASLLGVITALLVAGFAGSLTAAWRFDAIARDALQAQGEAETEREKAEAAGKELEKQIHEVKRAAAEARRVARESSETVTFLFEDVLAGSSGPKGFPADLTRALVSAEKKIEARYTRDPLVAAAVRHTLGMVRARTKDWPEAERQLRLARQLRRAELGADHAETLASQNNLAGALRMQGNLDEAAALIEHSLAATRRKANVDPKQQFAILANLASLHQDRGRAAEAIPLFEEARPFADRVLGRQHPTTLELLQRLASALLRQGRQAEADRLFAEVADRYGQAAPEVCYAGARIFAREACSTPKDKALPADRRASLVEIHLRQALALLGQCKQAGYFQRPSVVASFQQEPAFKELRESALGRTFMATLP